MLFHIDSYYLAKKANVKAQWLGISGAWIHVVSNQQHEFQQFAKAITFFQLLTGYRYCHDARLDIVYVLFKRQLEKDAIEARP